MALVLIRYSSRVSNSNESVEQENEVKLQLSAHEMTLFNTTNKHMNGTSRQYHMGHGYQYFIPLSHVRYDFIIRIGFDPLPPTILEYHSCYLSPD